RPGEAGHETNLHGILGQEEDDGRRRSCSLDRQRAIRQRGDHGDLAANQISRQLRQPIGLVLGKAIYDRYVLALHMASLFETLTKSEQAVRERVRRCGVKEADHRHRRLLRARRERPRGSRTAEQRDELAPFHSITSSACARSTEGTSSPSSLAVFRLINSSYLVWGLDWEIGDFSP